MYFILNLNCVTDTVSIITSDGRNFVVSIVHHSNTASFSSIEKCFQSCENGQCSTKMYILCVYTLAYVEYFFQGTLKGFDQTINLILDESHERVYSTNQGVEQVVLGLHIIRGDNV